MNITRKIFEEERQAERVKQLELSRELVIALSHIQNESGALGRLPILERSHITQKFNELIAIIKLYTERS